MADPFDPRAAALAHAYTAAVGAEMRDQGGSAKPIDGDAVQAIAAGLVYVGDRLEDIRRELWNANNAGRGACGGVSDERAGE